MKPTVIFSSSLLLPLLLFFDQHDAALNDVECGISNGNKICAEYSMASSMALVGDLNDTITLEAWSINFWYVVDSSTTSNETSMYNYEDPNWTGLEIYIERGVEFNYTEGRPEIDDWSCSVRIEYNGTELECASCSFCGDEKYAVDCTNVYINDEMTFSRPLTCEDSIFPIFFPVDDDTSITRSNDGSANRSLRGKVEYPEESTRQTLV